MRRLLVVLVVLGALAVAADRAAVAVAERSVADQLQRTEGLATTPTVELGGFPFLTQVVAGRYDEVRVAATGLERGGVRLAGVDATLSGVEARLGDVLSGDVSALPVERVRATVTVDFADLARRSGLRDVRLAAAGQAVRVTARVTVLGRTVTGTAVARPSLRGGTLSFRASSAEVSGADGQELRALVARALAFSVPVGDLPFGLSLTDVDVTPQGVRLEASAGRTVLRAG